MDLSQLSSRLREGRVFHSYIVSGPNEAAREEAAGLIARAAVCTGGPPLPCGRCRDCRKALSGVHPDITHVRLGKGSREHSVDSMRAVRAASYVAPNEGARSVYIIHDADAMNIQAQNAMLKVFEEPPGQAVFILLAENPQRLLPTVLSRCETLRLSPGAGDKPQADSEDKWLLESLLSWQPLSVSRACLSLEKLSRTDFLDLLDRLRRLLVLSAGSAGPRAVSAAARIFDRAQEYLEANVSSGHVAGLLMAGFIDPDHFE